ncbi:glycosyltransferase [Halobacillus sp. A1]|uniref:glycosyltransferase n=1 Tax=Halobacillus sp. A1 TaxID=2880262 RepID=UPI0020A6AA4A|nr:glycosyltransferase [Halobacillus sp. A1]MCP3030059.1 glycosyltransferase [Halobacillus sp. A1]
MAKVSIIIPLYNVEKYLRKCLRSVIDQTLSDVEIILVNDGSKDKSGEIAEEYKRNDSRIKVIHKENGGVCSARNAGLQISTGEYIGFVDPDDWIEPNMFEVMYYKALDSNSDLVVCNYDCVYEQSTTFKWLNIKDELIDVQELGLSNYYYEYFLKYTHGDIVWNKLYKRSIINEHFIKFEKHSEVFADDLLFNLYYLCHVKTICTVNRSFYNYFQRSNHSITSTPRPQLSKRYTRLVEYFIEYAKSQGEFRSISNIPPILFYLLFRNSISHKVKTEGDLSFIKEVFDSLSDSKVYKPLLKQLTFGNSPNIYCKQTGQSIKTNIYMRIYSGICLLHLNQLLTFLIKYEQSKK